jgi:hypothetical protein
MSVSTPGPKTRSTSPTVFEQQREELVREIAVVSYLPIWLLNYLSTYLTNTGHGTSPPKHQPAESESGECYLGMSIHQSYISNQIESYTSLP